ncbi:MAG: nucleotidyl transferase AbiEii/AbiGii toxin family protein [bacterium]
MFDKATHEKHIKKILITIFTDDIGKFLAFKGGTLAYLKHNLDRFSTDIDLDILDPTQEERIIKRVREILVMYGDIKGERSFNDSYRFVFRYNQEDMNIKVELNKRVWEHNTYEVQTIEEIDILCMTPDCMFTNKLVALSERFYPRDLYDVEFFNRKKFPLKELLIKERTGLSIKKFTQELVKELPNRLPKNKVLHNLGEVLTKKQQYRVKEYLLDEVVDFLKEKT